MIISIDNGVSGSIAILWNDGKVLLFEDMPVIRVLNYTKKKAWLHRINVSSLKLLLQYAITENDNKETIKVYIERPMVNPGRFKATISAMRCLEATLIVLDVLNLPCPTEYIDSKQWQKKILPQGIKGTPELKEAGICVAKRLFPNFEQYKIKDGDSLLMAECMRRKGVK